MQEQYDLIYSFFKTTTEPFDFLDWDGKVLRVWLDEEVVEVYEFEELQELIVGLR